MKRGSKASQCLEMYHMAIFNLSSDDRASFKNYFIGSLSVDVPKKKWIRSLEIAAACIKEEKE